VSRLSQEQHMTSSAVAEMGDRCRNRHRPKRGGSAVPLSRELGPRLVQCDEAASSSIQPFGHNRHGPKIGWEWVCPFYGSSWVHIEHRQKGQTDRTDRQPSDSIGRTFLQTVAEKVEKPMFRDKTRVWRLHHCKLEIFFRFLVRYNTVILFYQSHVHPVNQHCAFTMQLQIQKILLF